MALGNYLSSLTKPELEELKELLNLTDDEEMVFDLLSRGRGRIQIAEKTMVSVPTVDRRILGITKKIKRIEVQ